MAAATAAVAVEEAPGVAGARASTARDAIRCVFGSLHFLVVLAERARSYSVTAKSLRLRPDHDENAPIRVPAEGRGALLARGGDEGPSRRRSHDDIRPEDEVVENEHGDGQKVAAATAAASEQ